MTKITFNRTSTLGERAIRANAHVIGTLYQNEHNWTVALDWCVPFHANTIAAARAQIADRISGELGCTPGA